MLKAEQEKENRENYIAQALSLMSSGRQFAEDSQTWFELSGLQKRDTRTGAEIVEGLKAKIERRLADGTV